MVARICGLKEGAAGAAGEQITARIETGMKNTSRHVEKERAMILR
jgi:hypothetical protein